MPSWWILGGAVGGLVLLAQQGMAASPDDGELLVSPGAVTYSAAIRRFALAIAHAEGFDVPGSIPFRAHNPGDLKLPAGLSPLGTLDGHTIFASDADGWAALYRQLHLIVTGQSHVYELSMTIAQMGRLYAPPNAAVWASNVADFAGVSVSTSLNEVLT